MAEVVKAEAIGELVKCIVNEAHAEPEDAAQAVGFDELYESSLEGNLPRTERVWLSPAGRLFVRDSQDFTDEVAVCRWYTEREQEDRVRRKRSAAGAPLSRTAALDSSD